MDGLANRWPVGADVPVIVRRAKRALKRFDHDARAVHFLDGSGFGPLPSEEEHADLVKVCLDAQRDYIEDRLAVPA